MHFKNMRVFSKEFDMRALFDLLNSPLCENTRSTGADVAGEHKMQLRSGLMLANFWHSSGSGEYGIMAEC